jgi:hypothetical protein
LGREHGLAHQALADVRATAAVLDRMLDGHPDLPSECRGYTRSSAKLTSLAGCGLWMAR